MANQMFAFGIVEVTSVNLIGQRTKIEQAIRFVDGRWFVVRKGKFVEVE